VGREIGTYDLHTNTTIDEGFEGFCWKHYSIRESITWEYSWTGIIGSLANRVSFYWAYRLQAFYVQWLYGDMGLAGHM